LTPSGPNAAALPPKLNLHFDVCACSFGHYPWDDWERFARARGLDAETAGLGRLLVREAYNHGWEAWLQNLCGWSDDLPAPRLRQAGGQALLAFALRSPEKARWCFSRLMETDGLRGDVHPKTGEWTWGYLRLDTRRVLSTLHRATVDAPHPGPLPARSSRGEGASQSSIVNRKS
jgi:hypothetical protein